MALKTKKPSPKAAMVLAHFEQSESEAFQASVAPSCGRAIHSLFTATDWYGRGVGRFSTMKSDPDLDAASTRAQKALSKSMDAVVKKCGARSIHD